MKGEEEDFNWERIVASQFLMQKECVLRSEPGQGFGGTKFLINPLPK